MKKNTFTKIFALVLVVFGAFFFFDCSPGGGDDDGLTGGPELPGGIKGELADLGLGGNFPVPSQGNYTGGDWNNNVGTGDDPRFEITWSNITPEIFNAYKGVLDGRFGTGADAAVPVPEGMDAWVWEEGPSIPNGIQSIGLYYVNTAFTEDGETFQAGTLALWITPVPGGTPDGPELPDDIKRELTDLGLGGNFPVPSGGNYTSGEWNNNVGTGDDPRFEITWSDITQEIFNAYKGVLDVRFGTGAEATVSIPEEIDARLWEEASAGITIAEDIQSIGLYYVNTTFTEDDETFQAGTLMLWITPVPGSIPGSAELPDGIKGELTDLGLGDNFPVPSGGNYTSGEWNTSAAMGGHDRFEILWSDITPEIFNAYKGVLAGNFGEGAEADVAGWDIPEEMDTWVWEAGTSIPAGMEGIGLYYVNTTFTEDDETFQAGTLMLWITPVLELPDAEEAWIGTTVSITAEDDVQVYDGAGGALQPYSGEEKPLEAYFNNQGHQFNISGSKITSDGKLVFNLPALSNSDWSHVENWPAELTVNPPDAKMFMLDHFEITSAGHHLSWRNEAGVDAGHVYADKDCTITGSYDDTWYYPDRGDTSVTVRVNMILRAGWNTIIIDSTLTSPTMASGIPGNDFTWIYEEN